MQSLTYCQNHFCLAAHAIYFLLEPNLPTFTRHIEHPLSALQFMNYNNSLCTKPHRKMHSLCVALTHSLCENANSKHGPLTYMHISHWFVCCRYKKTWCRVASSRESTAFQCAIASVHTPWADCAESTELNLITF